MWISHICMDHHGSCLMWWLARHLLQQFTSLLLLLLLPVQDDMSILQRAPAIDSRQSPSTAARICPFEYRYLTEFQSHEPEFDYLKSLEIEEKINKVRWCNPSGGSRMLLSTNDKTIKLWKASQSSIAEVFNAASACLRCQP